MQEPGGVIQEEELQPALSPLSPGRYHSVLSYLDIKTTKRRARAEWEQRRPVRVFCPFLLPAPNAIISNLSANIPWQCCPDLKAPVSRLFSRGLSIRAAEETAAQP